MRIITGKARGIRLATLEGDATRPTSERVKEAVFSMLQFDIDGRSVLDLFAGCGQMSLEALRGSTALLPSVAYEAQSRAIGKNSQESVLSGVMLGHALMLDGFALRFAKEMKTALDKTRLFATGEYAPYILPLCKNKFEYDTELILCGLYLIYKKSKENRS